MQKSKGLFWNFLNMGNNASEAAWSICRGIGMGTVSTTTAPYFSRQRIEKLKNRKTKERLNTHLFLKKIDYSVSQWKSKTKTRPSPLKCSKESWSPQKTLILKWYYLSYVTSKSTKKSYYKVHPLRDYWSINPSSCKKVLLRILHYLSPKWYILIPISYKYI